MKALEYINSRRPNLEIRGSFLQQLQQWQLRRRKKGVPPATELWDPIPRSETKVSTVKQEEVLLRNTFINAQMVLTSEPSIEVPDLDQN